MRRIVPAVPALALAGLLAFAAGPVSGAAQPSPGTRRPGSAAASTVTFTVRPVILLVVTSSGRPEQLWTNIAGRPTPAQLHSTRVRVGGVHGRDLAVTPQLRAAAAAVEVHADWGRQGLVWSQP